MPETKTIYVPEELSEDTNAFFTQYGLYSAVYCGNRQKTKKIARKKLMCRYCKRSYPQTSFSKIAHIIPRFTGNTKYLAQDECDQCNKMFSGYESDLAHFLGVSRTLYEMKGSRGVPRFKSREKDAVTVEHEGKDKSGQYSSVLVRSNSLEKTVMTVDLGKHCVEIRLPKAGYVPVNVYKILVKMGLGMLPQEELSNFDLAMCYLTETDFHKRLKGLSVAYIQQTEYWYPQPVAYLFKKNDGQGKYPTYIFAVHLNNYFIQVVLPLYKPDFPMYSQPTQVGVRFVPVFLTTPPTGLFRRTGACLMNLESDELKSDDMEIFTAEFTMKEEDEIRLRNDPAGLDALKKEKIVAARIYFGSTES